MCPCGDMSEFQWMEVETILQDEDIDLTYEEMEELMDQLCLDDDSEIDRFDVMNTCQELFPEKCPEED